MQAAEGDKPQLTEGVTVAYTKPAKQSQVSSDSVGGVTCTNHIPVTLLIFLSEVKNNVCEVLYKDSSFELDPAKKHAQHWQFLFLIG